MTNDYTLKAAEQALRAYETGKERDPRRLHRITSLLMEAWSTEPQQRLGQFLSNLRGVGPQDIFYWDDDQLELALLLCLGRDPVEAPPLWVARSADARKGVE